MPRDALTQDISIRVAQPSDKDQLARLCEALWPESKADEHLAHVSPILDRPSLLKMPAMFLVAEAAGGKLIGFLEVGLRSHADGCDDAQAVGYIEGWYVVEAHRRQCVGARLLAAVEDWARGKGCMEMASDALIENQVSQRAHEALGYSVVDRCVHYRKAL